MNEDQVVYRVVHRAFELSEQEWVEFTTGAMRHHRDTRTACGTVPQYVSRLHGRTKSAAKCRRESWAKCQAAAGLQGVLHTLEKTFIMNTLSERWNPVAVPEFENLYQVSDLGRIKSLRTNTVLKPDSAGGKHPMVWLGKQARRYVHHLVAEAWIGPRPPGKLILHRDDDRFNNVPSNLYFGTPSQNMLDAVRNGKHPQARKTHCPAGHPYDEVNTRHYRRRRFCIACRDDRDRARAFPPALRTTQALHSGFR